MAEKYDEVCGGLKPIVHPEVKRKAGAKKTKKKPAASKKAKSSP